MQVFAYCQGSTIAVVVLNDVGRAQLYRTFPLKGKSPLLGGVLGPDDIHEHQVLSRAIPVKLNVSVDARQAMEGAITEMVRVLTNSR